jgi:hypothetical protein
VDLGDPVLEGCPFDFILDLAITQGTFESDGDDNSVNIINEKELFDQLASVITSAVQDATERQSILEKLDELKAERSKTDYLTKLAKFIAAAGSIAHFIGPYLPALAEKAASLL